MVLDGRAAALWGGGAGWPGFMTMASSREGARFIAPDAADIQRILGKHPFLKQVTQPAGAFPGQTAAIPSVGSWSFVLARPGLDEAVVYRLPRRCMQRRPSRRVSLQTQRRRIPWPWRPVSDCIPASCVTSRKGASIARPGSTNRHFQKPHLLKPASKAGVCSE